MEKALLVVFSNPISPEREDEYNRWYNDKHLRDVAAVQGFVSAIRYRLAKDVTMADGAIAVNSAKYLAIYELAADTPETLQRASDALGAAIERGDVDVSEYLDVATLEVTFALPISDRCVNPAARAMIAGASATG